MKKNILSLQGAKKLEKKTLKNINGGGPLPGHIPGLGGGSCGTTNDCDNPDDNSIYYMCCEGICIYSSSGEGMHQECDMIRGVTP